MRASLLLLALVLPACWARHPERDACYLRAEMHALTRAVSECDDPDDCEEWGNIFDELKTSQESCP